MPPATCAQTCVLKHVWCGVVWCVCVRVRVRVGGAVGQLARRWWSASWRRSHPTATLDGIPQYRALQHHHLPLQYHRLIPCRRRRAPCVTRVSNLVNTLSIPVVAHPAMLAVALCARCKAEAGAAALVCSLTSRFATVRCVAAWLSGCVWVDEWLQRSLSLAGTACSPAGECYCGDGSPLTPHTPQPSALSNLLSPQPWSAHSRPFLRHLVFRPVLVVFVWPPAASASHTVTLHATAAGPCATPASPHPLLLLRC